MRIESMFNVFPSRRMICCECGKEFDWTPEWNWYIGSKTGRLYYCRYSCYLKAFNDKESKRRKPPKKIPLTHLYSEEEKEEICRLYEQDKLSFERIAEKMNRSKTGVYNIIQKRYGRYKTIKERHDDEQRNQRDAG